MKWMSQILILLSACKIASKSAVVNLVTSVYLRTNKFCGKLDRKTEHRLGSKIMVGAESFRPCVVSGYVVSALGHFSLIWIVISFFFCL